MSFTLQCLEVRSPALLCWLHQVISVPGSFSLSAWSSALLSIFSVTSWSKVAAGFHLLHSRWEAKRREEGKCACSLTLSLLRKFPWAPTQHLSLLISHWPRLAARNSGTGSLSDGHLVPQKRITLCPRSNEHRPMSVVSSVLSVLLCSRDWTQELLGPAAAS